VGDKVIRYAVAGMLGQVASIAVNVASKTLFHFSQHLWVEYVAVLVFGHPPKGLAETLMALLGQQATA
jgi:hypothetical protein